MNTEPTTEPLKVLIAGAGVAGLEAMMALRDLAGPLVDVTVLTPNTHFVYAPDSVREPFAGPGAEGYPLAKIAADFGAELRHGSLYRVVPGDHTAITDDNEELHYDALILALGARRGEPFNGVTTFTGYGDGEGVHGLVQDVELGYTKSVDFVVPPGVNWPLPVYELALMTAGRAREMSMTPRIRIVTPEETPLAVFGPEASAEVAALLDAAGIEFVGEQRAEQQGQWRPVLRPSGESLQAERTITVSSLTGTAPAGVPADARRFVHTDTYGRVEGVDDVYAAGDGTDFPIEQGGIATQQADTIAAVIAKRAGAPLEPREFDPVLKGLLFTGGADHPLGGDQRAKIAGRYLTPYLDGPEVHAEHSLTSR